VLAIALAACSQPTNGTAPPPGLSNRAGSGAPVLEDPAEHSTAEAVGWADGHAIVVGSAGLTEATPSGANPITVDGARYHGWIRAVDDHGDLGWTRRLDAGREVHARAVAAAGGDLVIAGEYRAGDTRAYTGWVARLAPGGAERWRLEGLGEPGVTGLEAVAVRGDGTVVAGGMQHGTAWLVAIDGHGKLAWQRPVAGLDEVTAVMAAPGDAGGVGGGAGAIVAGVTGRTTTSAGTSRLVAIDAGGAPRWSTEAAEHGHGELFAIAPLADGGGVAVGQAPGGDGGDGAWIVRFAADGTLRSHQVVATPGSAAARAVAATGDGGFLVAGEVLDGPGRRGRLWRFDAAGALVWQQAYGAGEARLLGVAATPDGGAVAVGTIQTAGVTLRPWILGVDRRGAQRWTGH
jgi:hypothetical protein